MSKNEFFKNIVRILALLNGAINNIRLYSLKHPQVSRYMKTAYIGLTDILRSNPELTFLFIDDRVVVNQQPLPVDHSAVTNIASIFRNAGIERLTFVNGLEESVFSTFIQQLATDSGKNEHSIEGNPFLKIGKIQLNTLQGEELLQSLPDNRQIETVNDLKSIRDLKYSEVKSLYETIGKHRKIDIRSMDDMIRAFVKGFSQGLNPLTLLASLRASDEYTFTHVINVCILTMSQAEALGFSGAPLYKIGIASVLHDVGKLFIPEEVINKPGALNTEERKLIETHTLKGARYIIELDNIPQLAVLGALEHHIRFDGSGYPAIKGGWQPNIVSQMIAISDVFDALRSRRSYSEPKPQDTIIHILKKESGSAFNPYLVDNFLKIIRRNAPLNA